jgi:glucosamine--fructose-6-phosphate aminotransferase (isomerizing)
MCGIVAISSKSNILSELFTGLKRLEYRGYDSAGIAFLQNDKIICRKYKGRVSNLETKTDLNEKVYTAIGHTRWATHGIPSDINAHPHSNEELAVVHNGIIENYASLKKDLISRGYKFKSQTDTEVGMILLYDFIKQGMSKFEALKKMFQTVHGSFALVAIFKGDNKIYAIKKSSPMVVGYSKDKNFIASDVYAIAGLATHVSYIEDDEIVISSPEGTKIFTKEGVPVTRNKEEIKIMPNDVEKGTYEHYMLKEISEQSGAIRNNILEHYNVKSGQINFPFFDEDLSRFKFVKIIACGSSYNAGFIAKYWLEQYSLVEASIEVSSEFRYRSHNFNLEDTLYIFISQSGETADTMTALKYVKENKIKSSKILAIINVVESQIAKLADYIIECICGPEIGVAATKSFTSQLTSLAFLSLKIASDKHLLTESEIKDIIEKEIHFIPNKIDEFLNDGNSMKSLDDFCVNIANQIKEGLKIIYIGRGVFYGICMEAALKTQELFYIPILSFTAGELKHGPIAILDDKTCVITLSHNELMYEKTSSSIEEIAAREAKIALIANTHHPKATFFIDTTIFGDFNDITSPILYVVPIHLISYKISLLLGNDVDKPRGLAKSVTVE